MTTIKLPLTTEEINSGIRKEVFCNKCGMSCRGCIGNLNGLIEEKVYFNELVNIKVCGGYDSTHLGDGDIIKFSLCEKCLVELISTFSLYVKHGNYLFPEPYTEYWDELSDEQKWNALGSLKDADIIDWFKTCEISYLEFMLNSFKEKPIDQLSERDSDVIELVTNFLNKTK